MNNPKSLISKLAGPLAFAAVLIVSQIVSSPSGDRGTPPAILFLGVVFGLLTALVAAGLILIYRTTRIINFAQAAIGGMGGVFTYNLVVARTTTLPYLVAFLAGVIVAGVLGVVVELGFVRRFFNAPRLVLSVVTIALLPGLSLVSNFVRFLPIFGDAEDRSLLEIIGASEVNLPFEGSSFRIGDYALKFGFSHVFAILITVVALFGLAGFLRFTRPGIALRASSENVDRAMLLGINVKGLSTLAWGITGVLSGIGVILTATVLGSFQTVGAGSNTVLISALAAAVIARMRSLPVAVGAAVGIEILRQSMSFAFIEPEQVALFDVFLFLVILLGLLFQGRGEGRQRQSSDVSSWKAVEEVRPAPKEMMEVGGVRASRWIVPVIALVVVILFPLASPTGATNQAGYIAIAGIAILSLVVLTGWAGEVSLGQFALVAVGALMSGGAVEKMGIPFWIALPLVAVATAGFAVLIGLPALRIRGLFLAVTTYAFAFAVESNLFSQKYFGWLIPERVDRPTLIFFDFDDERSMYYLAVAAFLVCILLVTALRRSRIGRILIALRENEPNVQVFGINAMRARLWAFAFAGFLCGLAGVLMAVHQRAITRQTFPAFESLNIFIFAVIGGIGSVSGAVIGTLYYTLRTIYGGEPLLAAIIGPVGLLALLYITPGGLGSLAYGLRDGIFRIVAQRRQMIVPSLFADVDPAALERRLITLSEPQTHGGLAAIPVDQRYRMPSGLYAEKGRLLVGSAASADAAAITAAAESVGAGEAEGET